MTITSTISVLGTGDFGRALAKTLLQGGYDVVVGSRHPGRRDLAKCDKALEGVRMASIVEAIHESDVLFLAMHTEAQDHLKVLEDHLAGKILIDVSNIEKKEKISNAEKLQVMIPRSQVIKAFNTLSAYTMMTGYSAGNNDVYVSGDDPKSRETVCEIARKMGFNANIYGGLQSARHLESMTTKLFRGFGTPTIISFFNFAFWFTYGVIRYHYIKDHAWSRMPMYTLNKVMACAAITNLALCFLPGW